MGRVSNFIARYQSGGSRSLRSVYSSLSYLHGSIFTFSDLVVLPVMLSYSMVYVYTSFLVPRYDITWDGMCQGFPDLFHV